MGSRQPFSAADMRRDEPINVAASIENPPVDTHIGRSAPFSSFAVLLSL
jgi:hypothetical protein